MYLGTRFRVTSEDFRFVVGVSDGFRRLNHGYVSGRGRLREGKGFKVRGLFFTRTGHGVKKVCALRAREAKRDGLQNPMCQFPLDPSTGLALAAHPPRGWILG